MFYEIPGGTQIDIPDNAFGFIYKCWIPPVGYGVSSKSGKLLKTEILKNSDIPEEQLWVRPTLPHDYATKRKKEKEIQRHDPEYVDSYLEEIRKREWRRRLRGIWFWNYNPILKKSELIYITGLHYLYITYWKFQGKSMDFRMPDRDVFYVVDYCMNDPDCLGLNELTKRKNGKTARVGCWAYERVSRLENHHAGLQSKSDDDAEEAFKKAVILPWQKLPDFFKPRYDLMKGEEPSELRFFATARRGSKVEEDDLSIEKPLESFFDFKPSTEAAYDGPELHTYISDEAGKTKKPVSIKERQNVVRYCTEIDYEMKGKHWQTTTVETEKGEEENYEFQEVTANSNPLERDENNRTGTGLYTYFLPAQKGMYINKTYAKYGFPDEEMNMKSLSNSIRAYEEKNDTRGLSSFKRKNPRTFKEAFSADGEFALYNPELLNNRLDEISWTTKLTERGDLVWKDGYKVKRKKPGTERKLWNGEIICDYEPSEIEWIPNPNGKFEKVAGWMPREPNKVYLKESSGYCPNNNESYAMGCDPFRYDKTKDKRRSNCVGLVYQIPDPLYPDELYDNAFVLRYAFREESTRLSNEDILKMAFWCGCEVLFERNVNHWKNDFIDWECAPFLAWMPGEVEPGVITATGSAGVQMICNYTEAYINQHIGKVYFKSLIRKDTGWLGFKVEDTEKFDEPMSAGITLIKVKGTVRKMVAKATNLNDWFPKIKHSA
jgi:hypothetical protein